MPALGIIAAGAGSRVPAGNGRVPGMPGLAGTALAGKGLAPAVGGALAAATALGGAAAGLTGAAAFLGAGLSGWAALPGGDLLATGRFAGTAWATGCALRGAALATGARLRAPAFGACFLASALRPAPLLEVDFRAISMVSLLPVVVLQDLCTPVHIANDSAHTGADCRCAGRPPLLRPHPWLPTSAARPSRLLCLAWLPKLRTDPSVPAP
jgi:hypothetical protein